MADRARRHDRTPAVPGAVLHGSGPFLPFRADIADW
jgi:hypothetical protein